MKNLIMLIGISGSGKSTYLREKILNDVPELAKVLKEKNITLKDVIVCPDDIRREVAGSVNEFKADGYIWNTLVPERLRENMKNYGYAILDGINVTGKSRRKFLKQFRATHKIAVVFESDVALSKSRIRKDINENVDRSNVPDKVIDRQFEAYKNSLVDLKWDGVWNKPVMKKIVDKLKSEFKEVILVRK